MAGAKKRKDSKGHVLQRGECQDSTGRYSYKTMIDGKRYSVSAKSLAELRVKEEQLQKDIQDGINTTAANDTLNTFFERYMKTKINIRPSTKVHYYEEWKCNIETTLGKMKVCDIKPSTLKSFYAGLAEGTQEIDGKKKRLNRSTIQLLHNLISATLETAVDDNCIRQNPAAKAGKGIGGETKKKKSLEKGETKNFLEFVKSDNVFNVYYPLFVFAFSTGLRGAELLALQKSDVDLKTETVSITKQLQYRNMGNGSAEFYITDPKTSAGVRTVPLFPAARKALTLQKENDFILDKVGKRQTVAGLNQFVFVNRVGKPYTTTRLDCVLVRIVRKYNEQNPDEPLPNISLHTMRHTFSSRMAEKGMNPKVLQKIMGHSKISVTMDIYTHISETAITEEVKRLGDVVEITA